MSKIIGSDFLKKILLRPQYRWFRHFLLILFFLIVAFNGALFTFQDDLSSYHPPISLLLVTGMGYTLMYLAFGYFILYSIAPKLIKRRYTSFILLLLSGSIFLTIATLFFDYIVLKIYHIPLNAFSLYSAKYPIIRLLFNFFIYFTCFGSLLITVLLKSWFINTEKIYSLEQLNLERELEQLKGAINPDFLFDVLDHASSLAIKDPGQTSEIVLKLSKLLKYQLYESNKEKVLLISEIKFLDNFLALMKLLYTNLNFRIENTERINVWVPPLLYTSLLKDLIKGIQNREITYINIFFTKNDTILSFVCMYKWVTHQNIQWDLDTAKQQLNLLYPNQYDLKLKNNENECCLQLNISV